MQQITDFSNAYDRHARDVFRAALDVLRDRSLAEEVTQDVFLTFWRGSGYDAARGPLGPYLRRLARNRAVDVWRRGRTGAAVAGRLEHLALVAERAQQPAILDPCAAAEAAARAEAARAAVRELPDDQRRALVLTYWGGLTVAEAAEELDIPLGTAKSRIRLGLRRLARDSDLVAAA